MTIVKGGRTVFTTAGRLVTGLPSGYDYVATATLTFPDFSSKGWLYNWRWKSVGTGGTNSSASNVGDSYVKIPKQDTSSTTTLVAAPSSLVNLFMPKIRIARTTAPSHTWLGNTIAVKPPSNVWIPYTGSVLLEEQPGMARAFTLRITGGNLVMEQQQSVSQPPYWAINANGTANGVMYYGDTGVSSGAGQGGEWAIDNTAVSGLPVYNIDHQNPAAIVVIGGGLTNSSRRTSGTGGAPNGAFVGANAASITDPTNYRSIYSIEIAGKYARAS